MKPFHLRYASASLHQSTEPRYQTTNHYTVKYQKALSEYDSSSSRWRSLAINSDQLKDLHGLGLEKGKRTENKRAPNKRKPNLQHIGRS
jgi:hypothetical protein